MVFLELWMEEKRITPAIRDYTSLSHYKYTSIGVILAIRHSPYPSKQPRLYDLFISNHKILKFTIITKRNRCQDSGTVEEGAACTTDEPDTSGPPLRVRPCKFATSNGEDR